MPRIRTIKPTFWDDDRVNNTPLAALILFFGMKNFCDDKGIILANDKLIKAKVFPQRDDVRLKDVSQWITDLQENSLLVPLSFDGKGYYALDFSEEKIDKPQPSILPENALQECSRIFLPPQNNSRTFENIPAGIGEGKERKGIGEGKDIEAPLVPPQAPSAVSGTGEKKAGKPQSVEEAKNYFVIAVGDSKKQKSWPEDKCFAEARKFFDHYEANGWVQGTAKKPIKDWKAAARNWIRNELEGVFNAKPASTPPSLSPPVTRPAISAIPDKIAVELEYLYGRYLEGQCTIISIEPEHYNWLKKHADVNFPDELVAAIRQKAIVHRPDAAENEHVLKRFMKCFGVLEFFEQMKNQKKEVLLETPVD